MNLIIIGGLIILNIKVELKSRRSTQIRTTRRENMRQFQVFLGLHEKYQNKIKSRW
jgi:hypothetical protein